MKIFYSGNTIITPGDPVLIYGDGLNEVTHALISRLDDTDITVPEFISFPTPVSVPSDTEKINSAELCKVKDGIEPELLQVCDTSVKFFVPETLEQGVFALTLYGKKGDDITVYLNNPSVKWVQGDWGSVCTKGGWLRLNGERLSLDGNAPRVWLEGNGEYIELNNVKYIDAYSVEAEIPDSLAEGEYFVTLSNGYGNATACSVPLKVEICEKATTEGPIINVLDFGADPFGKTDSTSAFSNALDEAGRLGGAVVFVPRGRYWLTGVLNIPDNTTLKGESRSRTQLFWTPFDWEFGELPDAFITGNTDITIEDIDFRGTRVCSLFALGLDIYDAKNIIIRRVRAFFNAVAGSEFHVTQIENRAKAYSEVLKNGIRALVCVAGDNVQITDSEFACTGMTFGYTKEKGKKNFLFRNNRIQERISGWAYFVHSDNSIIEDNDFEGCTVGFGGTNAYLARNYIHDVLNNDREAFTTDMSYSRQTLQAEKIEGTRITFKSDVKLIQDRVIGYGGLYINSGKGMGQARKVVWFKDNVLEIDSPFEVEPDLTSLFSFGGTFRTAFYLIGNTCYNTGHIQFYVDQCSSVYDSNTMRCSAGLMLYSWQEPHDPKYEGGTMPLLTRTQTHFISMINNRIEDGNLFHKYGKGDSEHTDGWSGFAMIGCCVNGTSPTNVGMLIAKNKLSDNAYINIRPYRNDEYLMVEKSLEDAIIDSNTVSNSYTGIYMGENRANRMIICRNDFSDNVDVPMDINWDINKDTIMLI